MFVAVGKTPEQNPDYQYYQQCLAVALTGTVNRLQR